LLLINTIYYNRLSRNIKFYATSSNPHDAAVPIAPPTIALPTNIAPPTTIGAILGLGVLSNESIGVVNTRKVMLYNIDIYYFINKNNKN
jgi:hypothetical protein